MTSSNGQCRDCAQTGNPGFVLYEEEGVALWWYCLYCGSNHVTVDGVKQGDLYGEE